jgi:thymidylate synthase (FAD)
MQTIKLLDHGHVGLFESMGSDLSIVRNARVSYDAEWRAGEDEGKDRKLIHYLLKNGHTSPFESVQFTFDIKAPIFVFRQWHRHRTWSYNEISARYAELPQEMYVPDPHKLGAQSASNKQMRDVKELSPQELEEAISSSNIIRLANQDGYATYKKLIARGIPRELARGVLPVNTFSHMFATVDLHNLFHFLRLRLHAHAQYEIRVYAEAMLTLIEPIVPVAVAAFREHILGVKNG